MLGLCSCCNIYSFSFSRSAFLLSFTQVTAIYSPTIATVSSSCGLLQLLPASLLLSVCSALCLLLYVLFICTHASAFFSYVPVPSQLPQFRYLLQLRLGCDCHVSSFRSPKSVLYSKFKIFKTSFQNKGPNMNLQRQIDEIYPATFFLSPSSCKTMKN